MEYGLNRWKVEENYKNNSEKRYSKKCNGNKKLETKEQDEAEADEK